MDASKLFEKLARSASWWRRFFTSTDAEEIHQIVSELNPNDLAALDQRSREWSEYSYYHLNSWQFLSPADVGRLAKSKFATSLVGLVSFHHSGYVREAAVNELAAQSTGKELPFLLIRLNDWVVQVRTVAERAVRQRLSPKYAPHFLSNISLVSRLQMCGRLEKQLVDDVFGLLKRPECEESLRACMTSNDRMIRRIGFQLSIESNRGACTVALQQMMADPDALLRLLAVRQILPRITPDDLLSVIEPMLKDPFMPVRREALWTLTVRRPDVARNPIRRALLDSHVSMREAARRYLQIADVAEARAFYAETLKRCAEASFLGAICGLGESGNASDVCLLSDHFISPRTRIRAAAVYAVGKLDAPGNLDRLFGFLSDIKPSVSKQAMKALIPIAREIPLDDLEKLLMSSECHHVKRNALLLVLETGKWQKLPALLNACVNEDNKLANFATRTLENWITTYNRSFAEPSIAEIGRIRLALEKAEGRLPSRAADELRDCLRIFGDKSGAS
jgi:HEAT repeat protein